MAIAHSPIIRSSELPRTAEGRSPASILITAKSDTSSNPRTFPSYSSPLGSVTISLSAPLTTWALVSTYPSGFMMNPDPMLYTSCLYSRGRKNLPQNSSKNSSANGEKKGCSLTTRTCTTLMETTAGPTFCAACTMALWREPLISSCSEAAV